MCLNSANIHIVRIRPTYLDMLYTYGINQGVSIEIDRQWIWFVPMYYLNSLFLEYGHNKIVS